MADPILVIGTGTSVGKTHVAERVLRATAASGQRALGYKPVESGVEDPATTDAARLARASSFHVKPEPLRVVFRAPVSPHLAARIDGLTLDLDAIRGEIERLVRLAEALVVELPGGAFSPFSSDVLVAQFARTIPRARVVLVAADRLGVLHDVGATTRACASIGLPLFGLVLSAPAVPDDSTSRNARELPLVSRVPLLAELPREPGDSPIRASDPALALAHALTR